MRDQRIKQRVKDAREIRQLYFARRFKQVELASMYGITQGQVSRIISDQLYAV